MAESSSDVVRISIGTEPSQWLATLVLQSSIRRRTAARVEFTHSWTPATGWNWLIQTATKVRHGTKFSAWRWLVPAEYRWTGTAIYLDADQVVLGDVAELARMIAPGKAAAMVRNAVGIFGKKTPEPNKWQTSVMVMDCAACRWDAEKMFRSVEGGFMPYRDLMQATFLDDATLQEIDPAWNHFGIVRPDTKLLHYSHVATQPWKRPKHPACGTWCDELRAAIESGDVTRDDVRAAVVAGFVDEFFLTI